MLYSVFWVDLEKLWQFQIFLLLNAIALTTVSQRLIEMLDNFILYGK